jgi:DNA polymerase (family X)
MRAKQKIVDALVEIGRYLELSEKNRFKSAAYQRAARSLDDSSEEIEELISSQRLRELPGIGKSIEPIILELAAQGRSQYLEELRASYPTGIFDLLAVPSLGLGKIRLLQAELGVERLADLQRLCDEGALGGLPGFGPKSVEKICQGIAAARQRPTRVLLPEAIAQAERLLQRLKKIEGIDQVEIAGSIRRRLETIGNIDLAVRCSDVETVRRRLEKSQPVGEIEQISEHHLRAIRGAELSADLYLFDSDSFAAGLLAVTGNGEFVEAIRKLALKKDVDITRLPLKGGGAADAIVFDRLDLAWVEPELRESATLPRRKRPPKLIDRPEIRGAFHVHTTWSDGKDSMEAMLGEAVRQQFAYVGISDHSKLAHYAGGLSEARLKKQHQEIDSLRERFAETVVFRGSEVDILSDGGLDFDAATLATLDFTVCSIHSRFKMEREEMTERLVTALRNPFVTFLGHLSGRRLLRREPYQFDPDAVFEAAAENGVIIEINANPQRLDVDWRLMRRAVDRGVLFSIHPDAHSTGELGRLEFGVWNARKGGLEAKQIFNTREVDEVREYLETRRQRAVRLTRR